MLRKWFELSSVVPLAVYVLVHAASYVGVLFGAEGVSAGSGTGFELLLEVGLVWAPFAFHAAYGLWLTSQSSAGTARTGGTGGSSEAERRRSVVLRVTGVAALCFVVYHASWLRLPVLRGEQSSADTLLALTAGLSSMRWGVPVAAIAHLVGLGVVSVHLAVGLGRFLETWRITSSERAARVARALSVALFATGSAVVVELATGSALPNFVR